MKKIRVRFSKKGKIRFVSHRDVARIWERSLRKAQIKIAYSEGFSPRPKISFGLALPTGNESEAEYLDLELAEDIQENFDDLKEIQERINLALPLGLEVQKIAGKELRADSLQQVVVQSTWQFDLSGYTLEQAKKWSEGVLESSEIVVKRERKGKVVVEDLRNQVISIEVIEETEAGVRVQADLGTQPRTLRPSELLAASNPPIKARNVCRMNQWMLQGDERIEPLSINDAPAPSAQIADVTRRELNHVRTNGQASESRLNRQRVIRSTTKT
ncbi:MAG TPA: TIGR03936 family radical SAM-associated protein [Acidimicrobiales bacterium]|nr:TIGR03936 family radical SAM-associated protein [Acidimicrobiales bacterium]